MTYQGVCVGILIKNKKVLLGLRKKQNFWEFPGGSIEEGEQAENTVKRELHEELGIFAKEIEIAGSLSYYHTKIPKLITLFYITKWQGDIQKNCHKELKWFSLEECQQQKIPNINPELFENIQNILKKKIL